ncbi:MAG: hypothetical protein HOC71_11570 [Candidatus Latescibacteria bacterium]|jgi:hypothetical protein|nr:hypothetical protein [Candidatus Latescibacterota bacterium]
MYRIVHILTLVLFCLTLSAAVWADDPQAVAEVKNFHEDHYKKLETDTPEQVMERFAPGFIGYRANYNNPSLYMIKGGFLDPEDWIIDIAGPDDFRKYVEGVIKVQPAMIEWKKKDNIIIEIANVHVNGNHAISVSRQLNKWRDPTTNDDIMEEHRSVWFLSKIKGQWKFTSKISGISWSQLVIKNVPEM